MISKVLKGRSFKGAITYICKDQRRAEILATEGVRSNNYISMSQDFLLQQQMLPSKTKACFHSVLSFFPGENLSDETMVEIAKRYLINIGITNTQYAITKHTDKAHIHLHIVANMVDNNGGRIKESWIGLKGKKVAQNLTMEYNLITGLKKDIRAINMDTLNPSVANKYRIHSALKQEIPKCRTLKAIKNRMLKHSVETQFKFRGTSKEIIGISFRLGDDCFKGSKINRKFSLANLKKTLKHQIK